MWNVYRQRHLLLSLVHIITTVNYFLPTLVPGYLNLTNQHALLSTNSFWKCAKSERIPLYFFPIDISVFPMGPDELCEMFWWLRFCIVKSLVSASCGIVTGLHVRRRTLWTVRHPLPGCGVLDFSIPPPTLHHAPHSVISHFPAGWWRWWWFSQSSWLIILMILWPGPRCPVQSVCTVYSTAWRLYRAVLCRSRHCWPVLSVYKYV